MAHSLDLFRRLYEWLRLLTTHPISGGSNSSMECQDMAMTFDCPEAAVVNRTAGPGSINA